MSKGKVAIITLNRNKYSETFIQAHIQLLPDVLVYSNGYFPTSVSFDRGQTWNNLKSSKNSVKELVRSWKNNNVKVVLAEYGLSGVEVMNACKKANIPLVVHFHGFDAYRRDVLNSYGMRYKELFKKAAKIIVVSNDMYFQLLNLGCPKNKIVKIIYGVNPKIFYPPNNTEIRKGFIACGRFVHKKSPLTTIKAFSKVVEIFPNARITFIGEGELLDAAILLTKELKLESNVEFKGVLNPIEVANEMRKHAFFVQHSVKTIENDSEGTPLSILEAAASGLAIISTRHGGIPDVIIDGKNGCLVDEGDIYNMSEKMIHLYSNSEYALELGINARELIVNNYNQEDKIKELEICLNDLVRKPHWFSSLFFSSKVF